MRYGYRCEECEAAVWVPTTHKELEWLRGRRHVVEEVRKHLSAGLDGWMDEGLRFLDEHAGHPVMVVHKT